MRFVFYFLSLFSFFMIENMRVRERKEISFSSFFKSSGSWACITVPDMLSSPPGNPDPQLAMWLPAQQFNLLPIAASDLANLFYFTVCFHCKRLGVLSREKAKKSIFQWGVVMLQFSFLPIRILSTCTHTGHIFQVART